MRKAVLLIALLASFCSIGQTGLEIKLKGSTSLKYWRVMTLESADTTISFDLDDVTIPWEGTKMIFEGLYPGDYQLVFQSMFLDTLSSDVTIKEGHVAKADCPKRSYFKDVSITGFLSEIKFDTATVPFHIVTKHGMRHGPQEYEHLHFDSGSDRVSFFSLEDSAQYTKCAPQDLWEALKKFEKQAKLNNKKFYIPRYNSDHVRFYRTSLSYDNKVADYWYTSDMRYLFTRVTNELIECSESPPE